MNDDRRSIDAGPARDPERARGSEEHGTRPGICVFCGAKPGHAPYWTTLAQDVGRAIAQAGWALVYGGGRVGLMGTMADAALAAGGEVIGVIPERLVRAEVAHQGCTRLEEVSDMAVRKTRMIELSDAFVALPGGLGTLDELFEVLTLAQLHYHDKPIVLLDAHGFWDGLLRWGGHAVDVGFVHEADWQRLQVVSDVPQLTAALATAFQGR